MTAFADGLGQFVLRNDDVHAVLFFVDLDGLHLRRRHGVDGQLGRVVVPGHDVDALAGELPGHRLHPGPPHADAGAHRINAAVVGAYRDLRPGPRISGGAADLYDVFGYFRHFNFEQLHQHVRRSAGQHQLRAAIVRAQLQQQGAHPFAHAEVFPRNEVLSGDDALSGVAKVNGDAVSTHALDHAAEELPNPWRVLLLHPRPLRFADLLHDDLLGGLCGDAAELHRLHRLLQGAANFETSGARVLWRDLGCRIRLLLLVQVRHRPDAEGFVVPRFPVYGDAKIRLLVIALLGRHRQRALDGAINHLLGNALFVGNRVHHQKDVFCHACCRTLSQNAG